MDDYLKKSLLFSDSSFIICIRASPTPVRSSLRIPPHFCRQNVLSFFLRDEFFRISALIRTLVKFMKRRLLVTVNDVIGLIRKQRQDSHSLSRLHRCLAASWKRFLSILMILQIPRSLEWHQKSHTDRWWPASRSSASRALSTSQI